MRTVEYARPLPRVTWSLPYRDAVSEAALAFYREPAAMSAVPGSVPGVSELPGDVDGLRGVVQGLLLHRDLIAFYGVTGEDVRLDEQHLREVTAVLERALELRPEPDHGGPGARGPRAGDLPALRAPPHGLPAGAGDAGEGAVRVRRLLRAWEVDRPLDHGVVGRRSVGPARPADRRRAARGVRPRLRPLRPAPGAVPERCRGVARVAAPARSTRHASASSTCGVRRSSRATCCSTSRA